jgi:hypothetical protein
MREDDKRALKNAGASDTIVLPSDPFWPLQVRVARDGDPVPYQYHLLYRWQYGAPAASDDLSIGDEPIYAQADGIR